MRRSIFLCLFMLAAAFAVQASADESPGYDLEAWRSFLGEPPKAAGAPLSPGIAAIANKAYALVAYDAETQKIFATDKLCFFGDTDDAVFGIWLSTSAPEVGGFWVQWGHEVWVWGTDQEDLILQVSFIGRYLKSNEITGRFTLLDLESTYGAFRLRKIAFNKNCNEFL